MPDEIIDLAKFRARRDDAAVRGLLRWAAEAAHDHNISRAQFTRAAALAFLEAGRSPATTVVPTHHDRKAEAELAGELDWILSRHDRTPGQIGAVTISQCRDGLWQWRWSFRNEGWTKRLERGLPAQASATGHVPTRELARQAAVATLRALLPTRRQRLARALAGAWCWAVDRVMRRR